jgi:hypothetical protein
MLTATNKMISKRTENVPGSRNDHTLGTRVSRKQVASAVVGVGLFRIATMTPLWQKRAHLVQPQQPMCIARPAADKLPREQAYIPK